MLERQMVRKTDGKVRGTWEERRMSMLEVQMERKPDAMDRGKDGKKERTDIFVRGTVGKKDRCQG
jgi:hypothetical protein